MKWETVLHIVPPLEGSMSSGNNRVYILNSSHNRASANTVHPKNLFFSYAELWKVRFILVNLFYNHVTYVFVLLLYNLLYCIFTLFPSSLMFAFHSLKTRKTEKNTALIQQYIIESL